MHTDCHHKPSVFQCSSSGMPLLSPAAYRTGCTIHKVTALHWAITNAFSQIHSFFPLTPFSKPFKFFKNLGTPIFYTHLTLKTIGPWANLARANCLAQLWQTLWPIHQDMICSWLPPSLWPHRRHSHTYPGEDRLSIHKAAVPPTCPLLQIAWSTLSLSTLFPRKALPSPFHILPDYRCHHNLLEETSQCPPQLANIWLPELPTWTKGTAIVPQYWHVSRHRKMLV